MHYEFFHSSNIYIGRHVLPVVQTKCKIHLYSKQVWTAFVFYWSPMRAVAMQKVTRTWQAF